MKYYLRILSLFIALPSFLQGLEWDAWVMHTPPIWQYCIQQPPPLIASAAAIVTLGCLNCWLLYRNWHLKNMLRINQQVYQAQQELHAKSMSANPPALQRNAPDITREEIKHLIYDIVNNRVRDFATHHYVNEAIHHGTRTFITAEHVQNIFVSVMQQYNILLVGSKIKELDTRQTQLEHAINQLKAKKKL